MARKRCKSGTETELSIDQKLYEFRSAQKNFQGISFDTIAGYQEHGAIVHYEATEETAATLKPEGFLLLDSGGQYLDGTTDITRTIALGHVTEEQKKDYTLILKGSYSSPWLTSHMAPVAPSSTYWRDNLYGKKV